MLRSRQRLGDNPRDYDGTFSGLDDEYASPNGVYADSDVDSARLSAENPEAKVRFEPWKIRPPPPPPHWHWKDKDAAEKAVSSGAGTDQKKETSEEFRFEDFEIPGAHPWTYKIDDKGVFQVYVDEQGWCLF
jgi:AMP deaminase